MKTLFYFFAIIFFAILIENRKASANRGESNFDSGDGWIMDPNAGDTNNLFGAVGAMGGFTEDDNIGVGNIEVAQLVHAAVTDDDGIMDPNVVNGFLGAVGSMGGFTGDVNIEIDNTEVGAMTGDDVTIVIDGNAVTPSASPNPINSVLTNYYQQLASLLLPSFQSTSAVLTTSTTTTTTIPGSDDEDGNGSGNKDGVTTRKKCRKNQFDCRTGSSKTTCVKKSLVCDRTSDCPNGRDEQGCGIPIVGYLTDWKEAGSCSKTCGGGFRKETRSCIMGRFYNLCGGTRTRVVKCNEKSCQAIGSWGNWKEGRCSVTCGKGSMTYTRKCKKGVCPTGVSSFKSTCHKAACKASYKWGGWVNGACSRSCGGGEQEDTRTCTSGICPGSATRLSICNTQKCPAKWGPWVEGTCTKTCGGGQRLDKRTCLEGDCKGTSTKLYSCNTQECPAKWGPWIEGSCSQTCGGGEKVYSRTCLEGTCVGSTSYKSKCNTQACPVTYKWGPWVQGPCTLSCGGGKRWDRRTCVQGICPGSAAQLVNCNEHDCPAKWSSWVERECTQTCGGGQQHSVRTCLEGKCAGPSTKMTPCNTHDCPAIWGPWKDGVCSKSCGKGQRIDRRECIEGNCQGSRTKVTVCNNHTCPVTYEWSAWVQGTCTVTCGEGQSVDTRTCLKGSCPGSTTALSLCNLGTCPVWGPWKEGVCSATCGAGRREDTRTCMEGDCDGESSRIVFCNTNQCPLPAEYSPWKFGKCSVTCGEGLRSDVRFCIRGECDEDLSRIVICDEGSCAAPAEWGRWQPGPCSVSCGKGKRQYIRICHGGDDCEGVSSVFTECNDGECEDEVIPTNVWLAWSPWSACSTTCGAGLQIKERICDGNCTGSKTMNRTCFRKYCPVPSGEWTQCSRSCGWGTQVRVPYTRTADFRDCKIQDCPQKTCDHPYFKRFGNRSHSCCDVSPLLPGDVCGISSLQPGVGRLQGRIIGGGASRSQQWPWMVGILVNGLSWCGGALVDTEWVMTAAHCVVYGTNTTLPLNTIMLKFGTIDLKDTEENNAWVQTSEVSEIRFENYYFPKNDIAFLRLSNPPRTNSHVQPICLPQGEILPDDSICVAAGWGRVNVSGENPDMLQEVQVRLLSDDLCSLAYSRNFDRNIMKCAGRVEGGVDTCQGDSGGPLMCQRCSSCQWIAYGVVSFGDGCGLQHRPGVYAKVGSYGDWINSITQKEITAGNHGSCTSL